MSNITLFLQAKDGDPDVEYAAIDVRRFIGSTYPIEGVLGNGQMKVTQRAAGANMSVDVASGGCVVKCDTVTNGGSYLEYETTSVNVTIPAAPGSGSRTHLIVEQSVDPQSDGTTGGYNKSGPVCVQDTGSGATLPPSAYLLATVTVNHGDASVLNAAITDMRNQASGPPLYAKGTFTGSLTGAGRVTITHGLDVRPSTAFIQLDTNSNAYISRVVSIASDVITVEFINAATGATGASGQHVSGYWHADR